MNSYLWFLLAAVGEIAGCYTFWMWQRLGKSIAWLPAGMLSLALFAYALTRVDSSIAGRAYAAYGGIYILASLAWMTLVEKNRPDIWDITGTALCLIGSLFIILPARTS